MLEEDIKELFDKKLKEDSDLYEDVDFNNNNIFIDNDKNYAFKEVDKDLEDLLNRILNNKEFKQDELENEIELDVVKNEELTKDVFKKNNEEENNDEIKIVEEIEENRQKESFQEKIKNILNHKEKNDIKNVNSNSLNNNFINQIKENKIDNNNDTNNNIKLRIDIINDEKFFDRKIRNDEERIKLNEDKIIKEIGNNDRNQKNEVKNNNFVNQVTNSLNVKNLIKDNIKNKAIKKGIIEKDNQLKNNKELWFWSFDGKLEIKENKESIIKNFKKNGFTNTREEAIKKINEARAEFQGFCQAEKYTLKVFGKLNDNIKFNATCKTNLKDMSKQVNNINNSKDSGRFLVRYKK